MRDERFNSYELRLTQKSASVYLEKLKLGLTQYNDRKIDVLFDNKMVLGFGHIYNYSSDVSEMFVGTEGLSGRFNWPSSRVDDLSFTMAVTTLYHEYGHYLQNYGPDKDADNLIAELSVVGNSHYYNDNWYMLPHEISAESTGVMLAWDAMSRMFPGKADACMLNYINYKAKETTYMLDLNNGLFRSKSGVMKAFDFAQTKSLTQPRRSYGGFSRYDDESINLLIPDKKRLAVSPYYEFWNKLIDTMPGSQKDRKMAALVLHVRPEEKLRRPVLAQEDLSIEHEFGKPFPESTEASRKRLGINVQTRPRSLESNRSFGRLQRLWENMQAEAESEDDGPDFDI